MKTEKDRVFWSRMIPIVLVLCAVLSGCSSGKFDGSITSDGGELKIEYSVLDRKKESFIVLEAGDSLCVSSMQKTGCVDITVEIDGKEPIYEGKGLTDMKFTLNISEFGSYRISVTGHDACGSVIFQKNRKD